MPWQPVHRRSVPDEVVDQVLGEVVDGSLAPGETLPSERRLAEVLGVSRPAVREALGRMAQSRILEVRQGGATTVRDFRRHAGLDLLPRLLVRGGALDASVARSIVEARLVVGPGVAAMAASRGGPALTAPLTAAVDALEAAPDDVRRQHEALAFWDAVVDGADSLAFRLMFNSLRAAYEPAIEALAPLMADEVGQVAAYRVLTAAIGGGDPDTARAAAERVLRPATEALTERSPPLDADARRPARRPPGGPVSRTTPDDDARIEREARAEVAADERRITGSRRTSLTMRQALRQFLAAPSPWMIGAFLLGSVVARVALGGGSWLELLVPLGLVAAFPLIEWVIHVAILHWRPRSVGPLVVDSLLARKHREHHADPRDLPLVFIPTPALAWLLPAYVVVALLAVPSATWALTLLVSVYALKLGYEWTHYLVHSDYRPRSRAYRAVWRNHRLHHYKNEHYWFTVTTAGTADRLLGTYPDPAGVETSPTVRDLHAQEAART